ncbi:hypothetical protein QJS10_CPB17g02360 [Acorus calamus]|uniref:OTU domain-containing protein n=1 Tax=Acorus calamus TaxID=4465 RepID=A0AAV9CVP6_ACOCL|nr:hypothetical protein QJS10_CPB17g02360 [Acorus calamus]
MVKTKHKKSKPSKISNVKKQYKAADVAGFCSQLDALGLKIIKVTADGNCFFRALAYQLEGNEEEHLKYRHMVVQYILNHREEFEPFIEDDVPFDEYCQSMEKDGTWAGHMELQAASLVTHTQINSPRWYIKNFQSHESNMIHLSYHDGEHYNIVRSKDDSSEGPAKPIIIKVDDDLSKASNQGKASPTIQRGIPYNNVDDTQLIKLVMAGTGCQNVNKVKQILRDLDGDTDASIEFLIAENELTTDTLDENNEPWEETGTPHGMLVKFSKRKPTPRSAIPLATVVNHGRQRFRQVYQPRLYQKWKARATSEASQGMTEIISHSVGSELSDDHVSHHNIEMLSSKKDHPHRPETKHKDHSRSAAINFSTTPKKKFSASKVKKGRKKGAKGEAARDHDIQRRLSEAWTG